MKQIDASSLLMFSNSICQLRDLAPLRASYTLAFSGRCWRK